MGMTRLAMHTRTARQRAHPEPAGMHSVQAIRQPRWRPASGRSVRLHLGLATLLLGAACSGDAQGRDGADIYARRCINCHSIPRMTELLPTLGTPDRLRERLQALLPIHHAPDRRERDQLIDFLMAMRRDS